MNTTTIYIPLLEEGGFMARPTQAEYLGNECYRIMPTPDYEIANEIWKFKPGSIVKCVNHSDDMLGAGLLAYEEVK